MRITPRPSSAKVDGVRAAAPSNRGHRQAASEGSCQGNSNLSMSLSSLRPEADLLALVCSFLDVRSHVRLGTCSHRLLDICNMNVSWCPVIEARFRLDDERFLKHFVKQRPHALVLRHDNVSVSANGLQRWLKTGAGDALRYVHFGRAGLAAGPLETQDVALVLAARCHQLEHLVIPSASLKPTTTAPGDHYGDYKYDDGVHVAWHGAEVLTRLACVRAPLRVLDLSWKNTLGDPPIWDNDDDGKHFAPSSFSFSEQPWHLGNSGTNGAMHMHIHMHMADSDSEHSLDWSDDATLEGKLLPANGIIGIIDGDHDMTEHQKHFQKPRVMYKALGVIGQTLRSFSIRGVVISDSMVAAMCSLLGGLEHLSIGARGILPSSLAHLAGLSHLVSLELSMFSSPTRRGHGLGVRAAHIAQIRGVNAHTATATPTVVGLTAATTDGGPKLAFLRLSDCQVDGTMMAAVAECWGSTLTALDLDATEDDMSCVECNDADLSGALARLPQLQALRLCRTPKSLTCDGLSRLAVPRSTSMVLRSLVLVNNMGLSSYAMFCLSALPALEELAIVTAGRHMCFKTSLPLVVAKPSLRFLAIRARAREFSDAHLRSLLPQTMLENQTLHVLDLTVGFITLIQHACMFWHAIFCMHVFAGMSWHHRLGTDR